MPTWEDIHVSYATLRDLTQHDPRMMTIGPANSVFIRSQLEAFLSYVSDDDKPRIREVLHQIGLMQAGVGKNAGTDNGETENVD